MTKRPEGLDCALKPQGLRVKLYPTKFHKVVVEGEYRFMVNF